MQSLVDGLDSLLCMHTGGRSNNHCLQRGLRTQHLVIVQIRPGALDVLLGPFKLFWPRRGHGNDLCPGSQVVEMQGMAGAHTAEASDSDLKLGHNAIDQLRDNKLRKKLILIERVKKKMASL